MGIMEFFLWASFILASYQDIKKREVSDILTIAAWSSCWLLFDVKLFVLVFLVVWLIAEVCSKVKRPLMGFADVLWFPPAFMLMGKYGVLGSLVAVLLSQVYLWYRLKWSKESKEKVNGVPFVAILLVVTLAAILAGIAFL